MSLIRNIQQSVQNRDITKQASDIVVYIDGQDYLINPFLGDAGQSVPFNNFISSWESSYGTDNLTPSGSLTLSVPVQFDHLFRAPGGNNILKTMAEIRVFAKGYYFSKRGNTLYHQIFKGFVSVINYNMTGKMTTISLSCQGALGLLQKMQIDMAPAVMGSSPQETVATTTTCWNLDPYQMIAWVFIYSSMVDGFTQDALIQARMDSSNVNYAAISAPYIAKWQALLYDLARDVHIFGIANVQDVIAKIDKARKTTDAAGRPFDQQNQAVAHDLISTFSETATRTQQEPFYEALRGYMPDFGVGSIQLLNGKHTTRLERLRYLLDLVGFEGYQDIDGGVVIKPPLYNLDVNMLNPPNDGKVHDVDPSLLEMTDLTNPFIVQLSEIITEAETEDESAVRCTRLTGRGSYYPGFHVEATQTLLPTAEDIDIPLLTQFGIRAENPVECHWFESGDQHAIYAYVASELAKANRGLRTYSITIPLRPELKLGFPMYFPHKDCYGYIRSVSMNWTRGSTATTSVTLDSLRRRPMFPVDQQIKDPETGEMKTIRLMTPHNNLINKFTTPWVPDSVPGVSQADLVEATAAAVRQGFAPKPPDPSITQTSTLPLPQGAVVAQQEQMIQARQAGADYGINSDTSTLCWRIQPDNPRPKPKSNPVTPAAATPVTQTTTPTTAVTTRKVTLDSGETLEITGIPKSSPTATSSTAAATTTSSTAVATTTPALKQEAPDYTKGLFDHPRVLGELYYNDLRGARPYTNEAGYELTGPFPWGRWKSLKEALTLFTIEDSLWAGQPASSVIAPVNPTTANLSGTTAASGVSAFMFTGDSAAPQNESASALITAMATQDVLINRYKIFELSYDDSTGETIGNIGPVLTPSAPVAPISDIAAAAAKANTLAFGAALAKTPLFHSIVATIPVADAKLATTLAPPDDSFKIATPVQMLFNQKPGTLVQLAQSQFALRQAARGNTK